MDVKLLIDAIVRQTTVLIAQLSTSTGIRAPLAHIADQVFLDLAAEIEAQGVGRKIAADMFGLALRSYQKKSGHGLLLGRQLQRAKWRACELQCRPASGARRHRRARRCGQRHSRVRLHLQRRRVLLGRERQRTIRTRERANRYVLGPGQLLLRRLVRLRARLSGSGDDLSVTKRHC